MKNLSYKFVKKSSISELVEKVQLLELQIGEAKTFIKEIERGNLAIDLTNRDEGDSLASSLLNMRDQMKKIAEEEKQRNWTTEGLAQFVEILRSKNDNIKELGDTIISSVVKYMQANQGSLFVLNDDSGEPQLELIATYAYSRKKYQDLVIGLGEGLAGQAVLEKGTIYMTNLPGDYLKISSGLGEALPRNLLIVPLILNDNVYGVIEMASFNVIKDYQRVFIERLAESIASTLSAVKGNQQTRKLLSDTQLQTEQMRAQEEEMRQNMEELSATQEGMQRVLKEVEGKEAYVNQLLNISSDSIFTIDKEFKLVSWNKEFARSLEKFGMKLEKGIYTIDWYVGEEKTKQIGIYGRVFQGETITFTAPTEINGSTYYFLSSHSPVRNDKGEIIEVAVFSKDITEMTVAQKTAEKMRNEAQQQTEELKAQEEELRQNMEELSATQEGMQRLLKDVEGKEAYVKQLLNVSTDSVFTIDRDFKFVSWNSAFSRSIEKFGMKIEKGQSILDWYTGDESKKQVDMFNRVLKGEFFSFTASNIINGNEHFFLSTYAPLRDDKGAIFEIAIYSKDVTEMTQAQKKAEALRDEAQHQTEELKAQEEELRQNMEELSATQDEMMRVLQETERREAYTRQMLDVSKDLIFSIDAEFKLVSWNRAFEASLEVFGMKMEKGTNTLDWYPTEKEKNDQIAIYKRIFKGEKFEATSKNEINGGSYYFLNSYTPLKNDQGDVYEAVCLARDITEFQLLKEKMKEMEGGKKTN